MKRSYDSCRFGFKRCFLHYNYVANLQGSDMAMIPVDLNIGTNIFLMGSSSSFIGYFGMVYAGKYKGSTCICCSHCFF